MVCGWVLAVRVRVVGSLGLGTKLQFEPAETSQSVIKWRPVKASSNFKALVFRV